MTAWKEVLINDYLALRLIVAKYEQSIQYDTRIMALVEEEDKILKEINEIAESRNHAIEEARRKQDGITMQLKEKWDIEDKTFECNGGIATIRTTKSLIIADKKRLVTVLLDIGKLPEAIRSWNLSYLRKLKDVDMIEDTIAHYDEHQNVVIKGVQDK
jgi:ActR/RegA family two-component response regulator